MGDWPSSGGGRVDTIGADITGTGGTAVHAERPNPGQAEVVTPTAGP